MNKLVLLFAVAVMGLSILTSCRPPELEGAFVDFNAGRLDNALILAEDAAKKYPDNAEAWLLLGRLYGKKDRIAEMVNAYDKSLALSLQYANEIKLDRAYYYQTLFNKGVTSYNSFTKAEDRESEVSIKTIDNAILSFKDANRIQTDYRSVKLIATSFNISNRPDSAFVYYQELSKINPDTADAWIALGTYYFNIKEYETSAKNLNKALELDPKSIDAVTLLSQAYDMLNDTENAIKSYEKAKELIPEEKAFPYNLGLIYNKIVNIEGVDAAKKSLYFTKIIENFDAVIRLDPDIVVPYQMKSFAEMQQEKYDAAVVTLTAGLDHFPENGSLWFNLGVAYTHLQKKSEATSAFANADKYGY